MEADSKWQPELIDLSQVNGAFSFEEGYSRPDWKVISQAIQQRISGPLDLNTAWTEAARQWVMQLQSDLGGDYQVKDSPHFILLTALDGLASIKRREKLGHLVSYFGVRSQRANGS
jgi:hypothetical protein